MLNRGDLTFSQMRSKSAAGVQTHISAFSIAKVGPRNRGSSPVGSEVAIRERITSARERQQQRFSRAAKTNCCARTATPYLKQHCKLDGDSHELICVAMIELNLSVSAYDRILKVSGIIADLEGKTDI